MTYEEIMPALAKMGSPSIKKVHAQHGAKEPFYGVKVSDLKTIVKRVKKDHDLSLRLYASGVSDAMYLAALIADEKRITVRDLNRWVKEASWSMLSEYAVPWVAAESPHGWSLGLTWIDAKSEQTAAAGWSTLSSVLSITPDADLDHKAITGLLARIKKEITKAPNRVRATMNLFIIAVGTYVPELTPAAKALATALGPISIESAGTACKAPSAYDYIVKVEKMGRLGKKKKVARC